MNIKKIILWIGVFFLPIWALSQDQRKADSLIQVFEAKMYSPNEKSELLHGIASNHTLPDEIIRYSKLLIQEAEKNNNDFWKHKGLMELGAAYELKGDLDPALETFLNSFNAAKDADYKEGEGASLSVIANIYAIIGNHDNAIDYYNRAIEVLSQTNDSLTIATVFLNIGDEYVNNNEFDKALEYFNRSGKMFENLGYQIGTAYNLGNSGMAYAELGQNNLAEQNIEAAIKILESLEDYYPISVYLTYMSDIYVDKGDMNTAIQYSSRSLDLATKYGLKDQISEANKQLSLLYEILNDDTKAFSYFKEFVKYRDSLNNLETVQKLGDLRREFEVSQKQTEIDILNQQRENQRITMISTIIIASLLGFLAIGLYRRFTFTRKTKRVIEEEKNRSDSLLLNILPAQTAEELKAFGKVKAQKFESVTIMFTDFKGFTSHAEKLSPEALVESVDYYFSKFDEIIEKYGIEKIKTVGDAYMCACGLPNPSDSHALKMVQAAIEIANFVEKSKESNHNQAKFDIRIGINTGSVIAGVVGTKKFAYDIWGDAVNIASRMESNSEPGKINISEHTYELIKEDFKCIYRGEVSAKNRGKLKMYFIDEAIMSNVESG